ncbi:MAG: hypothetical protein EB101_06455, partial [Chitinophagia bacterium]|nr:hypothetical protein [Chitinophagia bacterium]
YNEAPPAKKQVLATTPSASQKQITKTAPSTSQKQAVKPLIDNKPKAVASTAANESTDKNDRPSAASPAVIKHPPAPVENNRKNELLKEIIITEKKISLLVYDNGEIDGDTVSVYLNGEVVLSKKRLSSTPLLLSLALDENQDVQEITFVAESLGRIPPNSALMIVDTGKQQHRLQVLSTDKKNAVFRFQYRPAR